MSEAGAFWLRAVGDNSYVSAVERERERKALFDSVKAALRGLVSAWLASSAPPVWRSDAAEPTAFVSAVARALTHAKKPSSSSSSSSPSISAEGAQFGSPEWVCESLNAQALAPRLRAATVADGQLQRQNYAEGAFVLDAELMAVLVDALEAVGAMRFELTAAPPQQKQQQQQRQRRRKRRATTVVRVLDEDDVDGAHSAPNPAPVHAALPRREASLTSLTQSADVQPESPDLEEEEEAQQEDEPLPSSPPPSADPVPEETAAAAAATAAKAATAVTPQPEPDQKPLQQQHQRQTSMSYADSLKETEAKLRQRFEQLKAMSRSSLSREEFRHLFDTPPPPKAESPKLPPMPAPEAASTTPEPAQMSSPEPAPAPAPAPLPAVPELAEPEDAPKPEPTSTPEPAEDTAPGSPPSTVTIAIDQEDSAERVDLAAKPVSPMATVLHNATAEKKDDKEETRNEASSRLFAEDDGKDQRAAESDAEKEKRIREATFTPFIAESIIIAEYDKRDTRRSLAEIVRSRMEEEQQQRKQGSSQQPAVVVAAAAAVLASSSSSSPPLPSVADASIDPAGPAAVAASKPPANWKPELKRLNLYLHTRGQPKAQGNKCFGCGAGMTEARFSSPRYCDFTGRFFCAKCHAGKKSVIPARVLHSWDFTQHPVNNTSLEYLASVEGTTLYDIALLNARLYRTAPVLKDLRIMRKKLFHMHDFVASCTKLVDGDPASTALRDLPRHLWANCETYTLAEFCKADTLLDKLMGVHSAWLAHISACPLCSQKGSICEICHSPKAIFPWELADTVMCTRCHGLFHRACYNKDLCPRCKRRQTRSLRL